jgi:hypothetical protein
MPTWLPPPTTVGTTALIPAQAQFGDIIFAEVVNPTRCPALKRQISTDAFPQATARSLPAVHLCRAYSRKEHPVRWTRRSCRSNIQRPHTPPDITAGCTPCHRAQLPNRFRVRYPTPTSPSAILLLLLLPQLLPQAPANHRSSWRPLSIATLSHPSQTLIKRRRRPPTFRMDLSLRALVRSHLLPTASRASPGPSILPQEGLGGWIATVHHHASANHRRHSYGPATWRKLCRRESMLCLGGAETDTGSQRPSREWADVGACASKAAIIPRPMLLGPGEIEVEGVGDANHPHSRFCSLNVRWRQTHAYSYLLAAITTHIKGRLRTRLRLEQCQTWPTLANGGQKYPGMDIRPRDVGGRLLTDYRLTVTTLSTLFIFSLWL